MSLIDLNNDDIVDLADNAIKGELRSLASYTAAATCRLLLLVAELHRRAIWNEWGVQSCAHWLSWQCGFSPNAAREHVRVALALTELPATVALFEQGELSYAKVRAITRAATPQNEELLVTYAKLATAAQLETIVRHLRKQGETDEANTVHADRSVLWREKQDGSVSLTINFTPEQAAVVRNAEAKALHDVSAETPIRAARVDAYVVMAETILANGGKPANDKYLVNLNVSAETLAEDADGECTVDGLDICPETARRLSCDAPVVVSLVDADGVVIKQGRKSRLFTGGSRAAVLNRDKYTCIFPSCNNRKWIDIHHITHWTQGGLTDPENGATLCDFHHRLIHEGGFTLDHSFTFRTPEGNVVPRVPAAVEPVVMVGAVDPNACHSLGNGDSWDFDIAVASLMERERLDGNLLDRIRAGTF